MSETGYETYSNHSTYDLLSMAEDFRASMALINGSEKPENSRQALPATSKSIASVGPDGVRFNFASGAIVNLMLAEISDMEGVADEGLRRIRDLPDRGVHAFTIHRMEFEIRKCLDTELGIPQPTLADINRLNKVIDRRLGPTVG